MTILAPSSSSSDGVVTAAEANRQFSRLLRGVREGRSYIVTSHGRPVARLLPIDDHAAERAQAREELFARLASQPALNLPRWSREELYDEMLAERGARE